MFDQVFAFLDRLLTTKDLTDLVVTDHEFRFPTFNGPMPAAY